MVRFRGHHLVCLQFYRGEGYGPEFVENLHRLLARVERGEEVEIIEGPDDVCHSCPNLVDERCVHQEGSEEEIKGLDRSALAYLDLKAGDRVVWSGVRKKVLAAPAEFFTFFCTGCYWEKVCHNPHRQEEG